MEIFMLTAVGITVSVALMINKKREPLHISFAALCLAIAFHKGASSSTQFFHSAPGFSSSGWGSSPSPLTIKFSRDFCEEQTLLKKRDIRTTALFSAGLAAILFHAGRGMEVPGAVHLPLRGSGPAPELPLP